MRASNFNAGLEREMVFRSISALFYMFAFVAAAQAEPVSVPAAEIRALLNGNTVHGTWSGEEYKQYFDPSGSTIYAPRKSQSTAGKWRVNDKTDQYESWWERSGWSAYGIAREDGQLFWISRGLSPQPFKVLPGQQLVWVQE